MWNKIISLIMTAVAFFCNIFGLEAPAINSYIFDNISYGEHERQTLDLYIPRENGGEVGLILMIHGGAWVAGSKSSYTDMIMDWSDNHGYAAAAINYRYLSYDVSFEDILDDIELALKCIKAKGEKVGAKINKVLLSGHSAGGHLSMLYAYSRKDSAPIEPVAVTNYCGPTDLLDPNFHNENATDALKELYRQIASLVYGEELSLDKAYLANDLLKKASPLYYIDESTVPTVINHGMKDDTVPYSNALSLEAKFIECGVTHIMNPHPNSGHGLDNDPEAQAKAEEYFKHYAETYLR